MKFKTLVVCLLGSCLCYELESVNCYFLNSFNHRYKNSYIESLNKEDDMKDYINRLFYKFNSNDICSYFTKLHEFIQSDLNCYETDEALIETLHNYINIVINYGIDIKKKIMFDDVLLYVVFDFRNINSIFEEFEKFKKKNNIYFLKNLFKKRKNNYSKFQNECKLILNEILDLINKLKNLKNSIGGYLRTHDKLFFDEDFIEYYMNSDRLLIKRTKTYIYYIINKLQNESDEDSYDYILKKLFQNNFNYIIKLLVYKNIIYSYNNYDFIYDIIENDLMLYFSNFQKILFLLNFKIVKGGLEKYIDEFDFKFSMKYKNNEYLICCNKIREIFYYFSIVINKKKFNEDEKFNDILYKKIYEFKENIKFFLEESKSFFITTIGYNLNLRSRKDIEIINFNLITFITYIIIKFLKNSLTLSEIRNICNNTNLLAEQLSYLDKNIKLLYDNLEQFEPFEKIDYLESFVKNTIKFFESSDVKNNNKQSLVPKYFITKLEILSTLIINIQKKYNSDKPLKIEEYHFFIDNIEKIYEISATFYANLFFNSKTKQKAIIDKIRTELLNDITVSIKKHYKFFKHIIQWVHKLITDINKEYMEMIHNNSIIEKTTLFKLMKAIHGMQKL